ncbi:MAG: cell division protein FtsZ [Lactobacillales bacterium]|jgi:cell division protein FtsZ|nr:cell division protein FtsZ [Lactobacillales bacterium]
MVDSEFLKTQTEDLSIGLATPPPEILLTPNIGVIGVGGAGGNAVNNMVLSGLSGISFFVANTDAQALSRSLVADRIQLGVALTQGLGAGANPEIGKAAAQEALDKIKEYLKGLHLLFITAGMGGGTGTGAAPVIAKLAKEMGILTVGVVSKPFKFEGNKRMRTAENGIVELQKYVDTLIVIPNQNLFRVAGSNTTFAEAFKIADDVLCQGVRSITDLVMNPGMINLDFADVKTVLSAMGRAMMGTGEAEGENRAELAAEKATSNPLLADSSIKGAKSILINISGGTDLTLNEVDLATERIISEVDPDANVIFGTSTDEALQGKIRISLVATGIEPGKPDIPPISTPRPPVVPPAPSTEPGQVHVEEVVIESAIAADGAGNVTQSVTTQTIDISIQPDVFIAPDVAQPPLFEDEVPKVGDVKPIQEVPDIKDPINTDSKKGDANVKNFRSSLFDLVPSLMGKLKEKSDKEKEKDPAAPAELDDFEAVDLPAFLRRK